MRIPRVTTLKHLGGFRVRVRFSDGVKGEANLRHHFAGQKGLLGELASEPAFATGRLNKTAGVLAWRNGVEFDPLVLGSEVSGRPSTNAKQEAPRQRSVHQLFARTVDLRGGPP